MTIINVGAAATGNRGDGGGGARLACAGMEVRRHDDPVAFERLVTPLLLADEARFNLELAVLGRLARGEVTDLDGAPLLFSVHDGDALAGAALRTPPWKLLVAAVPTVAMPALAEAAGPGIPSVLGGKEGTEAFGEAYAALHGLRWHADRAQGVYRLTTLVEPPHPAPGALRAADADEEPDLIHGWITAFAAEVRLPATPRERDLAAAREGRVFLWEVGGEAVCLVGVGGHTPNGARVGPVYTPPEFRGRGYASAATAAVTRRLLDSGKAYTFLYTDLDNPTSNKIYRALGYEQVADVQDVAFE